jgi:hypothetical protein
MAKVGRSWKFVNGLDPEEKRAGEIARYAFGSLYPVMGPVIVTIDNEQAKREFIESAIREVCSGRAPVGMVKYPLLKRFGD